ncbi:MAG: hypothetical protein IKL79_03540 [Clostridia bacterium]|nr:hypothetical protein [Clostridia bacterium]
MGRLIILAGGSAAGKSYVLQNCDKIGESYVKIIKKTTRSPRENENTMQSDLTHDCTRDDILKCEYRYLYGEHAYGIEKSSIDRVLNENKSPVVIVRRAQIIRNLIKDYSNAIVIYCHSKLSKNELREKLKSLGHPDSEIEDRIDKIEEDYLEYVNNFDLFKGVATNTFDDRFIEQIKQIINKEPAIERDKISLMLDFNRKGGDGLARSLVNSLAAVPGRRFRQTAASVHLEWNGEGEQKCIDAIKTSEILLFDLTNATSLDYYWLGRAKAERDVKDILVVAKKGTIIPFDIFDLKVYNYTETVEIFNEVFSPYFRITNDYFEV